MAEKQAPLGRVKLNNVRLAFPKLLEPTSTGEDQTKKRYGCELLIDPSTPHGKKNIKIIESAVEAVKKDEWKDKWDKIRFKEDRECFRDGNTCVNQESLEVYNGFEDMMALKATRQEHMKRPTLVTRSRQKITDADEQQAFVNEWMYGGAYVNAIVTIYAVSDQKRGGNGLFCALEGLQAYEHGEPFGATGISEDEFDDFGDEDADDDFTD